MSRVVGNTCESSLGIDTGTGIQVQAQVAGLPSSGLRASLQACDLILQ